MKEFADQLKSAAEDARNYGKIALELELDKLQKQLRMMHDQVHIYLRADSRRSPDEHFCPTKIVCVLFAIKSFFFVGYVACIRL